MLDMWYTALNVFNIKLYIVCTTVYILCAINLYLEHIILMHTLYNYFFCLHFALDVYLFFIHKSNLKLIN